MKFMYIDNIGRTQRALCRIGQKPMFCQSIKQRKSVFYCFSPHYLYIIKQIEKHCNKTRRTFENTRDM